jgi:hypothetical protein
MEKLIYAWIKIKKKGIQNNQIVLDLVSGMHIIANIPWYINLDLMYLFFII